MWFYSLWWQDDFMNFIIMFMASPDYVRNPYLRAKMVEVLNCWMPRRRYNYIFHMKINSSILHYKPVLVLKFLPASTVDHLLLLVYLKVTNCVLSILWGISWSSMSTLNSLVLILRSGLLFFYFTKGWFSNLCIGSGLLGFSYGRNIDYSLLFHVFLHLL